MKLPHKITTSLSLAIAATLLATSAGCGMKDFKPSKMFSLDNTWPFGDDSDVEQGTPTRVVGTWTDTVMTKQGQAPQRGFGGRLAFYDAENEKAIIVDGELVVYAFDETDRDPTDNKPTRRYVFPADQMKLRMSETDLGATYSFFLPWDEAGGSRTEVSLICRFQPTEGAVVVSEQTRHRLPGSLPAAGSVAQRQGPVLPEGVPSRPAQPTLESLRSQQANQSGAQQANYESSVGPQNGAPASAAVTPAPQQQMTVTSIALPSNFQHRDFSAAAAAAAQNTTTVGQPAGQLMPAAYQVQQAQYQQLQSQQPVAGPTSVNSAQMPAVNGAHPTQQHPVPQQYHTGTPQPMQPMAMPQVHATPISAFNKSAYSPAAPQSVGFSSAGLLQPQQQAAPQHVLVQPGQAMPGPTPAPATVSYPNQVQPR